MTFIVNVKPIMELSEEEADAQAEVDAELEAFANHELSVFLKLLELHTDLEPDKALEAFNAAFFVGVWNGDLMMSGRRGKVMLENAHWAFEMIEQKVWSYEDLATNLIVTLNKAKALGKA